MYNIVHNPEIVHSFSWKNSIEIYKQYIATNDKICKYIIYSKYLNVLHINGIYKVFKIHKNNINI